MNIEISTYPLRKSKMKCFYKPLYFIAIMLLALTSCEMSKQESKLLNAKNYRHHVDYFNAMEDENIAQAIPNAQSWDWMEANIPLFECPQQNFEEIYYYRWWTLRKHIKETPVGFAFTEFLVDRSYSDKYNLISCAVGHHIAESRWLHEDKYVKDYIHVWYRGNEGKPMSKLNKFSSWTPYATYERFLVDQDTTYLLDMYSDFVEEYSRWERDRRLPNGLFWQEDVKDGMEEQISGGRKVKNARPTINSYMVGNAMALSEMSELKGDKESSAFYSAKADTIKNLMDSILWNPELNFYETLRENGDYAGVREEIGFIPWFFEIPETDKTIAWQQVKDEKGFLAPFGITTAERRHPQFRGHGCCNCEWDGAVWPFATSQTLTGMANLLNGNEQNIVKDSTYFDLLETYVESQYYRGRPYIGEYLDETTGYWLKGDQERSRYYNHSTFNDLIITGLVGLRPRADDVLEVNPLVPADKWDWFALDNVKYHGRIITIIWDKNGTKYGKGTGLMVFADGKLVCSSPKLEKVTGKL
jgi:hypothetical protein